MATKMLWSIIIVKKIPLKLNYVPVALSVSVDLSYPFYSFQPKKNVCIEECQNMHNYYH